MKPYEWMIKYTPQTEWIERKGLLIWLSLYAGILGGGIYLVAAYLNNLPGMFISWLIVLVIKSGLHVAHAENPFKLWRMFLRPQTSWISRGLILTVMFIVFGAIQLALTYWLGGTAVETAFKVLTGIAAFGIMTYAGFTMSYVNGIPFWNSALLPALYMLWGILGGLAMALPYPGNGVTGTAVVLSLWLIVAIIIMLALYLWTSTYTEAAARESVREATRGTLSLVLWLGVGLFGILIPLAILLFHYLSASIPASSIALLILICEIVGGLAFTYSVLKAGVYGPLIPTSA